MDEALEEKMTTPPGYAVIDTETTGLPLRGKQPDGSPWPADAPGQPRLAAFAMISTTPGLAVQREDMIYIKPDGWRMEAGATAVNGLTDAFLRKNGRPVAEALQLYTDAIKEGRIIVAFNEVFDCKIMRGELRRAGMPDLFEETYRICAMKRSAGVVKATNARGQFKTPRLAEAMSHFKIPQSGHHTALGDAQSALEITRMLMQIGIDMTPEIARAAVAPPPKAQGSMFGDEEIPY